MGSKGFHARGTHWKTCDVQNGEGLHTGVDFPAPVGTRVVAARKGVTAHVDFGSAFGPNQLTVECSDGTEDFYAHMSSRIGAGIQVDAGDEIGAVGKEGNVTDAHLHFERHGQQGFWSCANAVNPQPSLDEEPEVDMTEEEHRALMDIRTRLRSLDKIRNRVTVDRPLALEELLSVNHLRIARIKTAVQEIHRSVKDLAELTAESLSEERRRELAASIARRLDELSIDTDDDVLEGAVGPS
ncbi:MAG: peptidoglycan DD-metalloendopeptidase family protein [Actinomycetes bacterium]